MSEQLASLHKKGISGKRSDGGAMPYSASTTTKITLGYKPRFVEVQRYKDDTHWAVDTYNADVSTTIQFLGVMNGTTRTSNTYAIPNTQNGVIASIDNDGFTVNPYPGAIITTYGTPYYTAAEE